MNKLYKERFLRNIGIMDEKGLETIRSTSIAVGGLGLGGAIFLNLVRLGFERFNIADPDSYDRTNFNRQRMAKENTIGRRKDDCLVEEAKAINPDVRIEMFRDGVKPSNAEKFLEGMDWVIDVIDVYAMEDKLALNRTARRMGLPVASCGSLGFTGSVIVFDASTPSFEELAGVSLSNPPLESLRNFLQFIAPEIPPYMADQLYRAMDHSIHIPFAVPGVEVAAATAAAQVANQVLGLGKRVLAPKGIFFDSLSGRSEIFEASYRARVFEQPRRVRKAA
jgi:molybdopterin/thiamine biosynthesis adenylyltransferase